MKSKAPSICKNQHRTPCKECPFRRSVEPGALGGSQPEVYIGQAEAGFYLPCHMRYKEGVSAKAQDPNEVAHCAGAAIFRSNVGVTVPMLPPDVAAQQRADFPKDTENVFASYGEFLAHHGHVSVIFANYLLDNITPLMLARAEARRAFAPGGTGRVHLVEREGR